LQQEVLQDASPEVVHLTCLVLLIAPLQFAASRWHFLFAAIAITVLSFISKLFVEAGFASLHPHGERGCHAFRSRKVHAVIDNQNELQKESRENQVRLAVGQILLMSDIPLTGIWNGTVLRNLLFLCHTRTWGPLNMPTDCLTTEWMRGARIVRCTKHTSSTSINWRA
jgi:hypothetical protein